MISRIISLNSERNVSLTVYLHDDEQVRPAVMVIPGGGYKNCAPGESDPAAFSYLNAGFQVMILRYTVGPEMVWPQPLEDYEMAMEEIRSHACEWNLNPDQVAVVGFSSGGHLAAAGAVLGKTRPNAAILVYAVVGDIVKLRNKTCPDLIPEVDELTPPCSLAQSRTDKNVPVLTSLRFMQALAEHNISFESHIYAYGPHGFSSASAFPTESNADTCGRIRNWTGDSIQWLKDVFGGRVLTISGAES